MTQWVQPLIDYLSQNPGMAWAIAFVVAMGEALFVIGLVVPSTAVLVAIGTLVGLGKLSFWPVFAMTVLGAIVGDALSFWFGHVYKERVKTMWPFSNYPDALDRGVDFMKKHGGKPVSSLLRSKTSPCATPSISTSTKKAGATVSSQATACW